MKWKSFKFKNYDNNDFIIWLFLILILISTLIALEDILFRVIFIMLLTILIVYAYNETIEKAQERLRDQRMRSISHLNRLKFKLDAIFSLWLFGVIFILFSLLMLVMYGEFFAIQLIPTEITVIISQVGIAVSILFILVGLLGSAIYQDNEKLLKLLKFLTNIGLALVILFIYLIIYPFLIGNEQLFVLVFYISLFIGLTLLILEEIIIKNKLSYLLLLLILAIISIIFVSDYLLAYYDFYFYRYIITYMIDNSLLTLSDILRKIHQIILIFLIILIAFYLIDYRELCKPEKENSKKYIEISIRLLVMLWVVFLVLGLMSYIF
jgi:hypothetical protein